MRTALPGTHHSTMVHRCEPMILSAVERCPGVKKVKTGRIAWTGSGSRRLQLGYARCHRTVEGWLFIGTAKRLVLIYPGPDVALETLGGRLAEMLARYKVCVEIKGRVLEERSHVQRGEGQAMRERLGEDIRMALVSEDSWPYCEQVYERVKQVKVLEEQEEFLVLQLEEIRNQKRNVQENTLAILAQMLSLPQG